MSISIFGLQPLTSKCNPAWPCRHDFDMKSSSWELYRIVFYLKSSLHGHAGVHLDVKGWSPNINTDIFEEPKNEKKNVDTINVVKVFVFIFLF